MAVNIQGSTAGASRDAYNMLTSGATSRQIIQMEDVIDILQPDATPFLRILSTLGKKTVRNWKYEWFTDNPFPHIDTVDGSVAAEGTTVRPDHPEYWQVWDRFVVGGDGGSNSPTYDVARVTANDGTDLTVEWITSSPSAVEDGVQIINIGSAFESGATYKEPKSTKENAHSNYMQIVRDSIGITEVLNVTAMYGGRDFPYQLRKKLQEHKRKLERNLLWGESDYDTDGTHPDGGMKGIRQFIQTNTNTSFGATTLAKWLTEIRTCTEADVDMSKLVVFTDLFVIQQLASLGNNLLRMRPGDKTLGLSIYMLEGVAPRPVRFIPHPELYSQGAGTSFQGTAYMLSVNPSRMKRVTLPGLDTHLRVDIANPGYMLRVDEYYTVQGLFLKHENTHNFLSGITAVA